MGCRFCGGPVDPERVAAGYTHCMNNQCLAYYHGEFRQRMALVLVPKQGFTFVPRDEVKNQSGRASGR